jgi:hypothetical protein
MIGYLLRMRENRGEERRRGKQALAEEVGVARRGKERDGTKWVVVLWRWWSVLVSLIVDQAWWRDKSKREMKLNSNSNTSAL